MNKNCDTELAIARLADVPLRDLGWGFGYGHGHGDGAEWGYGDDRGEGGGYGSGDDFGHGIGNGYGGCGYDGYSGNGDSAPHET